MGGRTSDNASALAEPSGSGPRRLENNTVVLANNTVVLALALVALCTLFLPNIATADEPALPPGLAEEEATPALPEGLGDETTPSLPEGLGDDTGPALPPGLAEESAAATDTAEPEKQPKLRPPDWLHGFWEVRGGLRTQDDPAQPRDAILGETRLQLKTEKTWNDIVLEGTADFIGDGVLEEGDFDLRRLRLTWRPLDNLDIRLGRQVLTWGTGDMLFINDLFPKDWQSFFIGRDVEYLKAPSDAVKVGWFNDIANLELVYTPQFEHDRFISGERISYWNPLFRNFAGRDSQVHYNAPSTWFEDDEWALRVYRNIGSYQLALYGYSGYWKSPGGQKLVRPARGLMQATFPKLNVYGASLRGMVGKGIANIEIGYYDSRQDPGGDNLFVNNSEFRVLVGYEREIAKEFTAAVQYYLEHMMDYDAYGNGLLARYMATRDKDRHVFTLRLTKLLMNQNLTLSLFTYYSPSDGDAYLRPHAKYKVNDHWTVEAGGNVFMGESDASFFGQFRNNTNVYAGMRYAF